MVSGAADNSVRLWDLRDKVGYMFDLFQKTFIEMQFFNCIIKAMCENIQLS